MGYPMTFSRLISRNGLGNYKEGYKHDSDDFSALRGDLLRFVEDTQDHDHIDWFVRITGATEHQVRQVLALVFNDERTITINNVPLGGAPKLREIIHGEEVFPSGEELTMRADRERIKELLKAYAELNESYFERISEWLKERNRADALQAKIDAKEKN
jgi:hypothetical protein